MSTKFRPIIHLLILLSVILSACGPAATEEPSGDRPGTPVYQQTIFDCNTGEGLPTAGDLIQPDAGCDSWQINRYERPFNAETQDTYFPDLDILSASLGTDGTWFYAKLNIFDKNEESGFLAGTYAIELDLDIDGRGDVLVLVKAPGEGATKDWTVTGVQFYGDGDNDVGNNVPLAPDSPSTSNGYDVLVFDQGDGDEPDLAWARLQPGTPSVLELAFKASAIYFSPTFKWWAWSDQGVDDPAEADYHDTFDHPQAGDAILGQTYFPSLAINQLDNTCASIWGAEPGDDPELCVNDPAVPQPSFEPSTTPQVSETPSITPTPPDETYTATPSPTPDDSQNTKTPTPTPTECFVHTPQVGQLVNGTPSATGTNSLQIAQDTNTPSGLITCTPTPTPSPTHTSTSTYTTTPCVPVGATANIAVTCTPTATSTHTLTATPTICYQYSVAGQFIDCTPTPTVTATPTDCYIAYAFAVINCTPTPTYTPTATATICYPQITGTPDPSATATSITAGAAAGQQIPCTPTPTFTATATICANGQTFAALVVCTPTPTATQCIVANNASTTVIICTATPTPTQCVSTDVAGALVPCTPTPQTAAMMVYPEQDTNCRRTPDGNAQIDDTLREGVGYVPLGRTPDNLYMLFRGPFNNARCWAASFLFLIPFGPLNTVPGSVLPYINYPTPTPTPTPAAAATSVPECSDGIDNDGDGNIDYGRDKHCSSPSDDNEAS